jgi:bifunctional UDP-N-acetylglucosamine pyrophosphorylase/glucosamine-1-phosphate N-acetyltransferase
VKLEGGSYIAAGSVITHDVPKDSLAIARARSILKEGWATLYRNRKKK